MTQVLIGLGAWFVAALGLGIGLGKMIAAHERASRMPAESQPRKTHRAA
ncbi:MAG TPA: hypothetical protein VH583_13485 [Vicinamibacterales bacterium]